MGPNEMLERMAKAYNYPQNWTPEDGGDPSKPLQAALRKLMEEMGWWRSSSGMVIGTHMTPEETIARVIEITELEL